MSSDFTPYSSEIGGTVVIVPDLSLNRYTVGKLALDGTIHVMGWLNFEPEIDLVGLAAEFCRVNHASIIAPSYGRAAEGYQEAASEAAQTKALVIDRNGPVFSTAAIPALIEIYDTRQAKSDFYNFNVDMPGAPFASVYVPDIQGRQYVNALRQHYRNLGFWLYRYQFESQPARRFWHEEEEEAAPIEKPGLPSGWSQDTRPVKIFGL